jgi:hypothetical protein
MVNAYVVIFDITNILLYFTLMILFIIHVPYCFDNFAFFSMNNIQHNYRHVIFIFVHTNLIMNVRQLAQTIIVN